MASTREQILEAVKALAVAALPTARVGRNISKPEEIPAGGLVVIRDGDPGEPETTLSPISYSYSHQIPLEIAAPTQAALDTMLIALGAAVLADRHLGGRVEFLDVQAPSANDVDVYGAVSARWADLSLTADYTLSNPLN
jgi:hypothetical protein